MLLPYQVLSAVQYINPVLRLLGKSLAVDGIDETVALFRIYGNAVYTGGSFTYNLHALYRDVLALHEELVGLKVSKHFGGELQVIICLRRGDIGAVENVVP